MSKALHIEHSPTGYRCGANRGCALAEQQEQQPISAFERYAALHLSSQQKRNLALYVNFPETGNQTTEFCHSYQLAVQQEISMLSKVSQHKAPIQHLHFTGHTSLYQPQLLELIVQRLHKHFALQNHNLFHYSISVDPYLMSWGSIGALRELGFNSIRLQLGSTEFCFKQIQTIYEAARTLDYNSISLTLHCEQSKLSPEQLTQLLSLDPERLQLIQQQPDQSFDQFAQQLTDSGYNHLGMGCFALPDDTFVSAREAGLLSCNACGQASSLDFDILGFGVAASSQIGALSYQNCPSTQHYLRAIAQKQLPGAIGRKSCTSFL